MAFADFYPISCIGFSGGISPPIISWRESVEVKYKARFQAVNVDNVTVVSQDLKIIFRGPDKIEVSSDYVLDVREDNVTVDVQYFFASTYYFVDGEPRFIDGIDCLEVVLNGRHINPDEISYFAIDPEPGIGGEYAAVFQFKFGRAGRHKVKLSYSQDVPGGFLAVKDAALKRGNLYGFSYDISPLQYWAGGVEDVRVELVVDGFNVTDFGVIFPSDFVFTPNGCKWEWRDLTDEVLSETDSMKLYFGKASWLGGDFTEVLREGGMDVYNSPNPNANVIKTLEQGERVYLYRDSDDPVYGDGIYERGWRKCRLLDNTEGFVITWLPEYFFDSFERRKIMGDFPGFYGRQNP
jgi:hypothetical protein